MHSECLSPIAIASDKFLLYNQIDACHMWFKSHSISIVYLQ